MGPFLAYVLFMNVAAFAMMGIDKAAARNGAWRIPENSLLLSALLGGSIGAYSGMMFFRHKTKHWYFRLGLPSFILMHASLGAMWLIARML